jgi:hypothetical protein
MLARTAAVAQDAGAPPGSERRVGGTHWPTYVVPGQPEFSTLYHDGRQVLVQTEERWKLACGSNPAGVTDADLQRLAERHAAAMKDGPIVVVDAGKRGRGMDIIFNLDGSVPPAAVPGFAMAEAYLESLFADTFTASIDVSFEDMGGGGVIGATSSAYVRDVPYSTSRTALVDGMDSDDVIQDWLPLGETVPVRYDGSSDAITQEGYVNWTKANYRATVGSVSGRAGSMTYNTQFTFDWDPSNGVMGGTISFVDVVIHETGHALGFVSATDWGEYLTSLDLYRFQRSDGAWDYNPDTYEEFQVRPRLVDYDNPNDDHQSDLIDFEYRMSDGNPYQGSHFREQYPWIGLMDPAIGYGETHYPTYFSSADLNMFDAVGYDYPPCVVPRFTQQPESQIVCGEGATVQLSVAVNIETVAYQWRIGSSNLVDDGVHILGATTPTLTIVGVTTGDVSGLYNCLVTNTSDGCTAVSDYAAVGVKDPVAVTQQPQDQTVPENQVTAFRVTATGSAPLTYQWRHNGVPLVNGGRIYYADTPNLVILGTMASDAGYYDVVITNFCGPVISEPGHLIVDTGFPKGDMNCDGLVNYRDINAFVLAQRGEALYYGQHPECHWYNADCNSNGSVGFDDINPFIDLLSGR